MYCIYRITNLINGKTYIGQHGYTKRLHDDYMGSGKLLHLAYKKYGIENFKKDILVFNVDNKEDINKLEKDYIALYRSKGHAEYNIADGGEGGNLGEVVNRKRAETMKRVLKGKPHSNEWNKKVSEAHKGKKHSEEWVRKISEANRERKRSEEFKVKVSAKLKGRKHSEEFRRKVSEACKGKKHGPMSEESRKKMSESHKGILKGRKLPEETKVKFSEAKKGRHWFNNGTISVQTFECPEGFVPGRLRH